jgi:nucleotide-binding universal stress UspA family protein
MVAANARTRRILLPVDGSVSSDHAVEYVIALAREGVEVDVDLMNVPVAVDSVYIRRFVTREMIETYYREEADKALESAAARLDHARVAYRRVVRPGQTGETIARHAAGGFDAVVMGTRGLGGVGNLVLGSVATRVLHLTDIPVTLVK